MNFDGEQWRGGRGGQGGQGARPPQRHEKMGAPKAPSVLRGCQMPECLAHTELRRDAHMRQKKHGRYLRLKFRIWAFEDALMELKIELFDSEVITG